MENYSLMVIDIEESKCEPLQTKIQYKRFILIYDSMTNLNPKLSARFKKASR